MVAELEAGQGAGIEILHDLLTSLDGLFDVDEVGEEHGVEGGGIVGLKGLPQINLLNEDEVGLGAEFGGRGLLGESWSERHREQREDECWLHAGIVAWTLFPSRYAAISCRLFCASPCRNVRQV